MKVMSVICAFVFAWIFCNTCIAYAADQPPVVNSTPVKLYGEIGHKESLAHLDNTLKTHREKLAAIRSASLPVENSASGQKPRVVASTTPESSLIGGAAFAPATPAAPPPNAMSPQADDVIPPDPSDSPPAGAAPSPAAVPTAPAAVPAALVAVPAAPYQKSFGVARPTAEPSIPVLKAEVAQQHYTVQWFMLPSWMAGTWRKDGDLTTRVTDLRSGSTSYNKTWTDNRLEAIWGHQRDSRGNYWHVNLLPSERDGLSGTTRVCFLTVAQQCERTDVSQLLTRTHYVVSESNAWNGQPLDTFQQESLNHYAMLGDGELLNSSSNRVFSYQGAPVRDGQLESRFRRVANFVPVESMGGIDLKASLSDYLDSIGQR